MIYIHSFAILLNNANIIASSSIQNIMKNMIENHHFKSRSNMLLSDFTSVISIFCASGSLNIQYAYADKRLKTDHFGQVNISIMLIHHVSSFSQSFAVNFQFIFTAEVPDHALEVHVQVFVLVWSYIMLLGIVFLLIKWVPFHQEVVFIVSIGSLITDAVRMDARLVTQLTRNQEKGTISIPTISLGRAWEIWKVLFFSENMFTNAI